MEKLSYEHKIKIELDLYSKVLVNVEVMIWKKGARDNAIKEIITLVRMFAQDNNLNMYSVKEYLIELLEKDIQKNIRQNQEMYLEEYNKAKEILEKDVR
jgi:hypothetical protein